MNINTNDSISTIDLHKIYDFLKMLKAELESANDICKKVDDWSFWLPHNINEIKDEQQERIGLNTTNYVSPSNQHWEFRPYM